jgi:SOS-response transcriptional repressor LexA
MNNYVQSVIADLKAGKTVLNYKEGGNSMAPLIHDGQRVTLVPIKDQTAIKPGDIVLCKVRGSIMTHLVKHVRNNKGKMQFQIANNHGHVNGWTSQVFGRCVDVYWERKTS